MKKMTMFNGLQFTNKAFFNVLEFNFKGGGNGGSEGGETDNTGEDEEIEN